jgi:hypothetical protein
MTPRSVYGGGQFHNELDRPLTRLIARKTRSGFGMLMMCLIHSVLPPQLAPASRRTMHTVLPAAAFMPGHGAVGDNQLDPDIKMIAAVWENLREGGIFIWNEFRKSRPTARSPTHAPRFRRMDVLARAIP